MKPLFRILCINIALFGAAVAGNTQELLTFDDIPAGGGLGPNPAVSNGYGGLIWNNFGVIDGLKTSPTYGYYTGVVSSPNVAFNFFGSPASLGVSSGLFNLESAYLTSALSSVPNLNIEVQGLVGTTKKFDNTYTVNNGGPTRINFDYIGIESAKFISGGEEFAMDNLVVSIPEPSGTSLILLSVALLVSLTAHRWAMKKTRRWLEAVSKFI